MTEVTMYAGSTADALTLFEQLEMKLEAHPGKHSVLKLQSHLQVCE